MGLVILLIVFLAWKCIPRGHEPCHAFVGLGDYGPTEAELVAAGWLEDRGDRDRGRRRHWRGGNACSG